MNESVYIKQTGEDSMSFTKVADVSSAIDSAKKIRNNEKSKHEKFNNVHHAARIPTIIIEKLMNDGRLTIDLMRGDKEQQIKLMNIIKSEYPYFLTTNHKNII